MTFINTQYLIYIMIAIVLLALWFNRLNISFFRWIKTYWFFERTWASKISSFFYLISLFLMMISLLDLRGPLKKVRASIPDQRTIILIDTSTSMLAEDVRPNRFVKALQMARHFVKNATGHQISIVLFSDIQKRLLPFTDDIDLVESRLATLEKNNSVGGGSNISQALLESIQYFELDNSEDDKSKTGNILIFTDAEEGESPFGVNIPANLNLAIVGVGTLLGSNITLRYEDGGFKGYKTFKGEPVVSKLDEKYIKEIGKNVKNFKYWIANSFSLPTDEIVDFFRSAYKNKEGVGNLNIRPVYSHYILIPAILIYGLAILLGRFPLFKVSKKMILIFSLLLSVGAKSTWAQDLEKDKQKEKKLDEIKKDLNQIKTGTVDREAILKTAEKMLRADDSESANKLYSEYAKKNDKEEILFNRATSLLKLNQLKEALPMVQDLLKNSKNEDLKNKLRQNIKASVQQKEKKQKEEDKKEEEKKKEEKKEDKKENQNKKENQEKKQEQQDKKQDKQQGQEEKSKQQQGQEQKKDPKDKDKEKKEENKKEEQKKEEEADNKPSTLEEKEKEIEKKRRMTKTPAMIKQIMNDDRDLQKKMMDTSTDKRREEKPKRDW